MIGVYGTRFVRLGHSIGSAIRCSHSCLELDYSRGFVNLVLPTGLLRSFMGKYLVNWINLSERSWGPTVSNPSLGSIVDASGSLSLDFQVPEGVISYSFLLAFYMFNSLLMNHKLNTNNLITGTKSDTSYRVSNQSHWIYCSSQRSSYSSHTC